MLFSRVRNPQILHMGEERPKFTEELKRRNVFRVALTYLVAAWLLVQVAATVFPHVGLPNSGVTLVVWLLLIGFFPTLIFAWAFEITPEGIRRESGLQRSDSEVALTARKLDYVIIGMLAVALVMFGFDRFGPSSGPQIEIITTEGPPSIAVLPFENRSDDESDTYFVNGVHDDILTSLANIGSMKVISRTSVEQFENTELPIPTIANMLGVTAILEGGVQRAGDRIRINVQLIDASTDEHIWANSYDRVINTENIFTIQSEISNTIAIALRAALTPDEEDRLTSIPTDVFEAYDAYLLGNQRLRQRRGETITEAIEYFKTATRLDPQFALAYVGLADSYILLNTYSNQPWDELAPLAKAAADKAIELDAGLGEAYASLAMIHAESREFDLPGPLFERALALSPNYATAYQWYGESLFFTGRYQEARPYLQKAVELDPLAPVAHSRLAEAYRGIQRYDEAETHYRRAIEIDPEFGTGYYSLSGLLYSGLGRLDEAAIFARRSLEKDPSLITRYRRLVEIFAEFGDEESAEYWMNKAGRIDDQNYSYRTMRRVLAALRGDEDTVIQIALNVLEEFPSAYREGNLVAAYHLRNGQTDQALAVYQASVPDLFEHETPRISVLTYSQAIYVANIYQRKEMHDKAEQMLRGWEEFVASSGDDAVPGFEISDVQKLAVEGQTTAALAALRTHVDAGWRFKLDYYLNVDPTLSNLRNEPEFQEIVEIIRADLAEQRAALDEIWDVEFNDIDQR